MNQAKFFQSPDRFRKWLESNRASAQEIWIGFYKKSARKKGITYSEALDQALCYGWIDAVVIRIDEKRWMKRFTPRKPGSIWSLINIKRAKELTELGLMTPSGLRVFNARLKEKSGIYAYEQKDAELAGDYERKLKANEKAWDYFQAQAPSYRKTVIHWIMRAKKEETRLRRLNELIKGSERGLRMDQFTYSLPTKRKTRFKTRTRQA